MRKHFLILMLMTLLPLAGFAQQLKVSDFDELDNITYGDADLPVVTVASTSTLTTNDYVVDAAKFYSDQNDEAGIAVANLATSDAGIYYRKVTGKGAYLDQVVWLIFRINAVAIQSSWVSNFDGVTYTGSKFTPSTTGKVVNPTPDPDLTLVEGTHYTVTYGENINAGTGTSGGSVTIKGIGNYGGEVTKYFDIAQKTFSNANVTIAVEDVDLEYTGHPQAPTVTVTDKASGKQLAAEDFDVLYKVGSASASTTKPTNAAKDIVITVQGKRNYTDAVLDPSKKFDIDQAVVLVTPSSTREYDGVKGFNRGTVETPNLPVVSYKYQGFVNGETEASSSANVQIAAGYKCEFNTTELNNAKNVKEGGYTLTVNDAKFTAANYTFVANPGKFTITPKALTVTADDLHPVIGTADEDLVFTVTLSGHETADAGNLAVGKAIIVEKAATASTDGSYKLTPKANPNATPAEKTTLANYAINEETGWVAGKLTYVNGKLTIAINETAAAAKLTKVYDGTWSETITLTKDELTFTPSTVDVTNLTLPTATIVGIAAAKGKVDTYQVKLSNASLTNYDIKYISSQYTVTRRPLTISINAQTIESGSNPATEGVFNKDLFTVKTMVEGEANPFELYLDNAALDGGLIKNAGNYIKLKLKANTSEVNYANIAANYQYNTAVTGKLVIAGAGTFVLDDNATIEIATADLPASAVDVTFSSSRSFKPQQWYAMVLPFEVSVAKLSNAFGYAIVNRLNTTSTTADHVAFKLEMQKIPANEPFLIKIVGDESGETYIAREMNNVTIPSVTLVVPQEKSVGSETTNQFTGNYTYEKELTGNKIGFLSKGEWVCPFDNVKKMQPMDAYLQYSVARTASSQAPLITVEDENGTTAIMSVAADGRFVEADGWYTLNGVKLQGAPTEKGIYIRNGKKVVVK